LAMSRQSRRVPTVPQPLVRPRCSTSEWADDELSVARSHQVARRAIARARRLLGHRRLVMLEAPSRYPTAGLLRVGRTRRSMPLDTPSGRSSRVSYPWGPLLSRQARQFTAAHRVRGYPRRRIGRTVRSPPISHLTVPVSLRSGREVRFPGVLVWADVFGETG
jgi:hypothetical protein